MFHFLFLASALLLVVAEGTSSAVNAPYDKVEAEDFTEVAGGVHLYAGCTYAGVTFSGQSGQPNNYASYPGLDFEDGTQLVTVRLNANFRNYTVGYLYLRLGSPDAEPVAQITVTTTGAGCSFLPINNFLLEQVSGIQDLFLTFEANDTGDITIDWFHFTKTYV